VQAWPQLPQLPLSAAKLTQPPLQLLGVPLLQERLHVVALQLAIPVDAPVVGPGQEVVQEAPQ
jgi:hypothetical protein